MRKIKRVKKQQVIDSFLKSITYLCSLISVVVLALILFFIFNNGRKLFSWQLVTSDYHANPYRLSTPENYPKKDFTNPKMAGTYFSNDFGFAVEDSKTIEGIATIRFVYIDENSPLLHMVNEQNEKVVVETGFIFDSTLEATYSDGSSKIIFSKYGAENLVNNLIGATKINYINLKEEGGGIKGSIVTTLYLVFLTLIIGLPFGVLTALYLHEIAPQNKITNILRTFVDMLTGVPSIIYGLMGAAVFIPFTTKLFNNPDMQRGSLIAGALTMVVIILPVVIKATESALDVVPKAYKEASFALGATKTQTTFKVMLPNALPGILSAAILSIGRVIGESAALIFTMGTFIGDNVSITGRSTSLAVHIWAVMGGEIPNIPLATAISIIILIVVLILNLLVKLITNRFVKKHQ